MIISNEQLERVLDYVKSGSESTRETDASSLVSPDLAARIRTSMAGLPDVREERIAAARAHLSHGALNADDVAEKVIARAVSDSIR